MGHEQGIGVLLGDRFFDDSDIHDWREAIVVSRSYAIACLEIGLQTRSLIRRCKDIRYLIFRSLDARVTAWQDVNIAKASDCDHASIRNLVVIYSIAKSCALSTNSLRNFNDYTSSTTSRPVNTTPHCQEAAIMATELAVQSERAYQKQPHIFQNHKSKATKSKKVGKGGRRWYKDVGLGFRTPKTAIDGSYIGQYPR